MGQIMPMANSTNWRLYFSLTLKPKAETILEYATLNYRQVNLQKSQM